MNNTKKYVTIISILSFLIPGIGYSSDVGIIKSFDKEKDVIDHKIYSELLKEKVALDTEIKRLKKELSEKEKIITNQNKKILNLARNNMVQHDKYSDNIEIASKEQNAFIDKNKIFEKIENAEINDLKKNQQGMLNSSNQKNSMKHLVTLLKEQFQEEIESGKIQIKFQKRKIE